MFPDQTLSPRLQRWLFGLTVGFAALTVIFGIWAQAGALAGLNDAPEGLGWLTEIVFSAAGLLAFNRPTPLPAGWQYGVAQLSATGFALSASSVLLLTLLASVRTTLRRAHIKLATALRPERGHTVIIGLGETGWNLLEDLRRTPDTSESPGGRVRPRRNVIVIELDPRNVYLSGTKELGALIVGGDAREPGVRRRALLAGALEVFLTTGDDGLNIDLVGEIARDVGKLHRGSNKRPPVRCYVELRNSETEQAITGQNLISDQVGLVVHLTNRWKAAARQMFADRETGIGIRHPPRECEVPHYVLFGFGSMGREAALQIGRGAHFPCLKRPRITICDDFESDPEAQRGRERFFAQYPGFSPVMNLSEHISTEDEDRDGWSRANGVLSPAWEVGHEGAVEYAAHAEFLDLPGRVVAPRVLETLRQHFDVRQPAPRPRPAILLCFDTERDNVLGALGLRDYLRRGGTDHLPLPIPIHVFLPTGQGFADLVTLAPDPDFPITGFGQRSTCSSYEASAGPLLEELAWYLNQAYEDAAEGEDAVQAIVEPPEAWIGRAKASFRRLSRSHREASREAAAHAIVKLRSVGLTLGGSAGSLPSDLGSSERLARMEHNRWMAERLIAGWRYEPPPPGFAALGEAGQNAIRLDLNRRKRRSALTPWELLSEGERDKDRELIRQMGRAIRAAGQGVEHYSVPQSSVIPGSM